MHNVEDYTRTRLVARRVAGMFLFCEIFVVLRETFLLFCAVNFSLVHSLRDTDRNWMYKFFCTFFRTLLSFGCAGQLSTGRFSYSSVKLRTYVKNLLLVIHTLRGFYCRKRKLLTFLTLKNERWVNLGQTWVDLQLVALKTIVLTNMDLCFFTIFEYFKNYRTHDLWIFL